MNPEPPEPFASGVISQVPPPLVPPVIEPAVVPAIPPVEPVPFFFHGTSAEYFRIWIVNTLLTLVTCGVFSAWAKVRKRRYLRSNTELLGHRFDYRANPRRILAGNVIVAILFLAYGLFGAVYPVLRGLTVLIGVLLLPWIVVRSLAFNAHNTVYRGLRFRFRHNYTDAIFTYLLKPLLILVTLGFYYPAWVRTRRKFIVTNHRLGDAFFHFETPSGPFYSAYLLGGAFVFLCAIVGGLLMTYLRHNKGTPPTLVELVPFLLIYGAALFVAKHFIYARLFNHVWNHIRLDDHRFVARMGENRWLLLQLGNLGMIIATGGLLYPWATIRSARYALSCLHFVPASPIDRISRMGGGADGSAMGDSAAEFVGLDFGL